MSTGCYHRGSVAGRMMHRWLILGKHLRDCARLPWPLLLLLAVTAHGDPAVWRPSHVAGKDVRTILDRLHAANNPRREDDAFLNAVGAVWNEDVKPAAAGDRAGTGMLVDACHVLTSLHVVFTESDVFAATTARRTFFAVGQTVGESNRGALQGAKFLAAGTVIAHGDSLLLDNVVHHPESDWALIRLDANADAAIVPLALAAVDSGQLPRHTRVFAAGFPVDHRERRGEGFKFKDLWGSQGEVVAVTWLSTAGAILESTIQATPGESGGPLYGDFAGRSHVVIGMLESMRGNGIDTSEDRPNIQVLFTPQTLAAIRAAQAATPCLPSAG